MKKAKIYKPTKTAMQSGTAKTKDWILEYIVEKNTINPLMGWESSKNTLSELNLKFSSRDSAIKYAKKNKIKYEVIEPKNKKVIKKSYADNFTK